MKRFVPLFILSPFIIFFTYLVIGYFLYIFYGCTRDCVLNTPFDIFSLGYIFFNYSLVLLPFSLITLVPFVVFFIISAKNHVIRYAINQRTKIILMGISALVPLPGIISVINRANQHPYYWDVVNKGLDTSYLAFVIGDIFKYVIFYVIFLVVIFFLIKLFEIHPSQKL